MLMRTLLVIKRYSPYIIARAFRNHFDKITRGLIVIK